MPTRRRTRRTPHRVVRLAPLLLVAPLATLGSAVLAANVMPVTYAGVDRISLLAETRLSADDAKVNVAQEGGKDYYHFIQVSATLASVGVVSGRTITFTANGGLICEATTSASGSAHCPNNTKVLTSDFANGTPTIFTATFAGGDGLAAATASGHLTEVGP